jgi:hypothetical protein
MPRLSAVGIPALKDEVLRANLIISLALGFALHRSRLFQRQYRRDGRQQ